jgi:hypothetical protein
MLLLEDFEHRTNSIVCYPGQIVIELPSIIDSATNKSALLGLTGAGSIITTHYEYNDYGEQ